MIGFRYFRERLRFYQHNTRSYRALVKKEDLTEKEFEKLFIRMTDLECIQMQLRLIKKNQDLVNKMLPDDKESILRKSSIKNYMS